LHHLSEVSIQQWLSIKNSEHYLLTNAYIDAICATAEQYLAYDIYIINLG